MKAITAVCATGAAVPAIMNGRVGRQQRATNGENAEIKMYLSKLKDLVPFMPKNRKLSKLEIIQHVIDYICDLQSELETSPAVSNFDAAAVLHELQQHDDRISNQNYHHNSSSAPTTPTTTPTSSASSSPTSHHQQLQNIIRQPLVDRSSPNLILTSSAIDNHHNHHHHQHHQHQHQQHHQHHHHHHQSNPGHYNHQSSSHTTTDKINSEGNSRS